MKGEIRCFQGSLWRHDPQPDDPELETRVGDCLHCDGLGCEEIDRRAAAAKNVTRTSFVLDGTCKTCAALAKGEMYPPHDASPRCESGKRPHCTCDTCF